MPTDTTLPSTAVPTRAGGGLVLVVLDPSCPRMVRLPGDGRVTIGRGTSADVAIDDREASRVHVQLSMGPGLGASSEPSIHLRDNHSRNGTLVGGERLGPGITRRLALGESFQIGQTLLSVQREELVPRPHRVFSHAYLVARLDEELIRASSRDERREVLLARFSLQEAGEESRTVAAMGTVLRPSDVIARPASGELEVLLCEAPPGEGHRLVANLIEAIVEVGVQSRCATAVYPDDGPSTIALLDAVEARRKNGAPGVAQGSGTDAPSVDFLARLERAAAGTSTVLLLGETGTGKSLMAKRLHALSPRAQGPFVTCDCGAISRSLLESELFGYARGAFTGAVVARTGLIEAADGGTLFLDEIAELPLEQQVKLLTVLDGKTVRRIGETKGRVVDFRLVASTNRDLRALVRQGLFRAELFYRLNVIRITFPALRDRPTDVEELTRQFLAEAGAALGRSLVLAPETMPYLRAYPWPGNIRELRHAVERAAAGAVGDALTPGDFQLDEPSPVEAYIAGNGAGGSPKPATGNWQAAEITREQLLHALMEHGGNRTRTSKALGRSREWLRQKCIELGIPLGR